MRKCRFTQEQIISILREQEAGTKTLDVCRRHGISQSTIREWKAKCGGLDVSDAKRLRALEDENAKLNKLLAEAMLESADSVRDIKMTRLWTKDEVTPSARSVWNSSPRTRRQVSSRPARASCHDVCSDSGGDHSER